MKYIWFIMMHRIYLLLFLVLPLPLVAQSNPWQAWEADVVRSLNTAADIEYLNEEEKKVILFMNMARHNGSLFAETFRLVFSLGIIPIR